MREYNPYMRSGLRHTLALVAAGLLAASASSTALARETHTVDGGDFLIEWKGDFSGAQRDRLRDWLSALDPAISQLHGAWPRPQIRIEFVPVDAISGASPYTSPSPVPFARVIRLRPEGILFYVDANKSLDAFVNDWTAYHELSHLFIPYPGRAGSWFSEGLASYYQNILQVRNGVLTPDQARDRLAAAFERGRANSQHGDLDLGELSRRMMERRAFQRVYWSGALYFLEADLALRARSQPDGAPLTLDDVLRDFGECCLRDGEKMRARDIAKEFDRLAAADIFVPLFDRYEGTTAIPDWEPILGAPGTAEILGFPGG